MRLWHILQSRLRSQVFRNRREADLRDELQFHLERETETLLASGLSSAEARARAMARFGSVTVAADACRDARGTALVDSVVRDVLYACRSFRRAPLAALTIVTTVALGLGLVAVVFTFLNAFIFRVDDVRSPHELFAVVRQPSAGAEPEPFTRARYDALVRETDVFSGAFAITDVDSVIDAQRMEGALVTGNFFQVLGVSAARGRILTPADDEMGGRQAIVLSHRAWSRYFASDPAVLGRTVLVNRVTFQVVGVMPGGFRGLAVAPPDYWAPLSTVGRFRRVQPGREDSVEIGVIGRLKPGLTREQALAELRAWDVRPAPTERSESSGHAPSTVEKRTAQRATLLLEPRPGTVPLSPDVILLFTPLFVAFGLILMTACANVANLLLARAVTRQREIGIRLAIGAARGRIIRQLLTESLLLALVSAALAFGISRLVLAAVVYAVTSTWPPAIGDIRLAVPPADWRVALFLLGGAMVSTVFFALAPALQATRIELVRAVRGEVVRNARPGLARNMLVALQVTASVLLLACSAVFLRSTWAASTIDPGVRTADTVFVSIANEQMRGATLDTVRSEPSVTAVAASWPGGLGGGRAAFAQGASGKATAAYKFVSPEFFGVLGIAIVRGRGFTSAERSARVAVAVVSESVARELWPGRDAVGQVLRLEPDTRRETPRPDEPPLLSRTLDVVGIARDVRGLGWFGRSTDAYEAVVYVPIAADAAQTSLTVRVQGDPERARRALVERLAAIDSDVGEVMTLRTITGMVAYLLDIAFWLTLALGSLALVLTVSGLFSVLSYLVEQRGKEIGVRMALGATRRGVAAFVLSQLAAPVGIGILLGGGLTAALGGVLQASVAPIGSVVRLFDPLAYAGSLLCIVAACAGAALIPALRAGQIDPIAALRQE
jgi:predicted permease